MMSCTSSGIGKSLCSSLAKSSRDAHENVMINSAYRRIISRDFVSPAAVASQIDAARRDRLCDSLPRSRIRSSQRREFSASAFLHASRVCDRSRDSLSVFLAPYPLSLLPSASVARRVCSSFARADRNNERTTAPIVSP